MTSFLPVFFLIVQCTRALDLLPAPVNVTMLSVNFRHELTWDPGPGTPPGTHYKVLVRTESVLFLLKLMFDNRPEPPFQHPGINFPREAEECDTPIIGAHPPVPFFENGDHHPGLPFHRKNKYTKQKLSNTTRCFLKLAKFSYYDISVQAVYNHSLVSPRSPELEFFPSKQTTISEPELSLVGGDHRLELNITLPKMHKAAKIPDIQKFYDFKYRIEWKEAGSGGKTMSIDTTNSSVVLDRLTGGMEYCMRVHMMIRIKRPPPSHWVCAWTSVPEPSNVPTVLWITVPVLALVVLGMVGLSLVLHYAGLLGEIKARLPAALLMSFIHSYLLTPETTIPERVYLHPEADKQKRRNAHPQSAVEGPRLKDEDKDEDEDEDDADRGQSGYMNRAGELSSDSESQDEPGDSSGILRDGARPMVDSGEVPVVELPLPVSHGQLEVRGPSIEWPVMLDGAQHGTVDSAVSRCERDEGRVSVDVPRGEVEDVNLFSVTLAKGDSGNINLCSVIFGKNKKTADNEPGVEYDLNMRMLGSAASQSATPSDTQVVLPPAVLDPGQCHSGESGCQARRGREGVATSCSSILSHGGETDNEEELEEVSGYLGRC